MASEVPTSVLSLARGADFGKILTGALVTCGLSVWAGKIFT